MEPVHPVAQFASSLDAPTVADVDRLLHLLYMTEPSSQRDGLSDDLFDLRALLTGRPRPLPEPQPG